MDDYLLGIQGYYVQETDLNSQYKEVPVATAELGKLTVSDLPLLADEILHLSYALAVLNTAEEPRRDSWYAEKEPNREFGTPRTRLTAPRPLTAAELADEREKIADRRRGLWRQAQDSAERILAWTSASAMHLAKLPTAARAYIFEARETVDNLWVCGELQKDIDSLLGDPALPFITGDTSRMLFRWQALIRGSENQAQTASVHTLSISDTQHQAAASRRGTKTKGDIAPLRSWTQSDLDEAIRTYKAERSSTYSDLVEGVRLGRKGATKSARKTFGRNQVAKHFGVKSHAMVSKSPVWQQIADELRLPRGRKAKSLQRRVGLDVAIEQKALADRTDPAIRKEIDGLILKHMPTADAEAMIARLDRGEMTVEQAHATVDLAREQRAEDRARRL